MGGALRTLVIAHGHPDFGIGGGELAAYTLFRALKDHRDVEDARFLAGTRAVSVAGAALQTNAVASLRPAEYLWRRRTAEWFTLEGDRRNEALESFRLFLRDAAPDIVFIHHYVHLGIEIVGEIRRTLPEARLMLTLHDYALICHNGGLMLKTGFARSLCEAAAPTACNACFPDRSPAAFASRADDLKHRLAAVDRFVSPSRFLRERHVAWGVSPDRIVVIGNGIEPLSVGANGAESEALRLGFFGQLRCEKGLDILLAALHRLSAKDRARVRLEVNGSRLEAQPGWYRELVRRLSEPLVAAGAVVWRGPYGREDLADRMGAVEAVAVPSVWWENSPMVIQEAFACGRPVIGSRIGGIAENVREGVDAILFETGASAALAAILSGLLADPHRLSEMAASIRAPMSASQMADAYLALM